MNVLRAADSDIQGVINGSQSSPLPAVMLLIKLGSDE